MPNLADFIEEYLMRLLTATERGRVDIQRQEIARMFNCAPSQINYVLDTRFTHERGYVIESRRGGGGFIRIIRITETPVNWLDAVRRETANGVTARGAEHILGRLAEAEVLEAGETALIRSIIAQETGDIPPPVGDVIRAMLLRSILTVILAHSGR